MLVLLALACAPAPSPPPPTGAYADALALVEQDPSAGVQACEALPPGSLRVDCLGVAAERLAKTDASAAAAVCQSLPAGLWRDECHFQVAERSGESDRCAAAGRFAEDCRMHHWSRGLVGVLPQGATPAGAEEQLAARAAAAGFADEDPRPWIAAFRLLGARMSPLDRSLCAPLSSPNRVDLCRQALRDHYNDLLNHARDTGGFPCGGGPLPPRLAYTPDPELDALVASRRVEDLCGSP